MGSLKCCKFIIVYTWVYLRIKAFKIERLTGGPSIAFPTWWRCSRCRNRRWWWWRRGWRTRWGRRTSSATSRPFSVWCTKTSRDSVPTCPRLPIAAATATTTKGSIVEIVFFAWHCINQWISVAWVPEPGSLVCVFSFLAV